MASKIRQAVLQALLPGTGFTKDQLVDIVKTTKGVSLLQRWGLSDNVEQILKDLLAEKRVQVSYSRRHPEQRLYTIVYGKATIERKPTKPRLRSR